MCQKYRAKSLGAVKNFSWIADKNECHNKPLPSPSICAPVEMKTKKNASINKKSKQQKLFNLRLGRFHSFIGETTKLVKIA